MKLTIIIPVYNTGKYIAKCLASLNIENYNNIEVIVFNDCSTDDSHQIILTYTQQHPAQITYINLEKNIGTLAVRLLGIEQSLGRYIIFLDSDDWVEENSIQYILDIIDLDQYDLIKLNYCYNDKKYIWYPSAKSNVMNNKGVFIKYLINGNYFMCQFVYKRSLFNEHILTFLNHINGTLLMKEDVLVNHLILPNVKSYYDLDKLVYHYYIRTDSITNTNSIDRNIKNIKDIFFVLKNINDNSDEYKQYYDNEVKNCYDNALLVYSLTKDIKILQYFYDIFHIQPLKNKKLYWIVLQVKLYYYLHKFSIKLLPYGSKRRELIKKAFKFIFHR